MNYKKGLIDELPELVKTNFQIFSGMYEWPPYTLDQYTERLNGVNPTIFIAERDDKIIGDSIAFEKDGGWYLWILGVLEEYRKQGVATQLLDLNEQYARENSYKEITVKVYNVSKEMLKLLIGRGYEIVDIHKDKNSKYNGIVLRLIL